MPEASLDISPSVQAEPGSDTRVKIEDAKNLATIVKPEEKPGEVKPTKTPEEIWQELDENEKAVALAIGTMTINPDIHILNDMLLQQQKNHPEKQYNATLAVMKLANRGVLERKEQVKIDNEIIASYEASGKKPISYSHDKPTSHRQEVDSEVYTGAKMRQEELEKNPDGHPEWKLQRFALIPAFRNHVLKQTIQT